MPKIEYVSRKFSVSSEAMIAQANDIIAEYRAQGFVLTLRQLYYQFVSRDLLANKQQEYKRLGSVINDARLAGMIDWEAIEDRTRNLEEQASWSDPESILSAVADQYRKKKSADQPYCIEAWIEKDALTGVIDPVCRELEIPYFACRGYSSQSEQWRAGQRFVQHWKKRGQKTVVLHLGDHDPSGIDMTRDNFDRLNMFAQAHGAPAVKVERLALNMAQVEEYNPPPNPAKITDSRANNYIERFGDESWELDALEPSVIANLIRVAVNKYRDKARWQAHVDIEEQQKAALQRLTDHWAEVEIFLEDL